MSASTKLDPVIYKEGLLFKRQRGLKQGNTKKLKFQERFCRLTCTSLDYYDPNVKKRGEGPKGQFAVEQIKVVEAMEKDIFGKDYPYSFQIGDSTEIMYFVAKTQQDMEEWLAACRHVARDAGNLFLSHHHHGVFGLINKSRWSCCANTSRGSPGCSPSTLKEERKPEKKGLSKPPLPVQRTLSSTPSPVLFNKEQHRSPALPRSVTPNFALERLRDSDNSDEENEAHPPRAPLIRRFTLADPIFVPDTPKKIRRGISSEKEGDLDQPSKDQLKEGNSSSSDQSKEKNNIHNSMNSLNSPGRSGKKEEEEETKEGVVTSKESLTSGESKGDSSGIKVECSTHRDQLERLRKNQNVKKVTGDIHLLDKERTGASSPSPSVDSGRGVSRPNSQIDVVDLRVPRTESVGKKSVQSVVSDQGAMSDEGKHSTSSQIIIEETDGLSKQVGGEVGVAMTPSSDTTEEKYKDRGSQQAEGKLVVTSPRHRPGIRKLSSPPAPDIMFLRGSSPSEENTDRPRPLSFCVTEGESSETELSKSVTPQHRKLLANMATGSPKMNRPKSTLLSGVTADVQQYSQLHQACKDGNLVMLKEELNKAEPVNLDEPSNSPTPYPPLFIAYMNDHYQIMLSLLEHGANPNCVEPRKRASLLQWASDKGCLDFVDLLIKYKADVNKRDSNGETPLMAACRNGHLDVVELLLENGANVDDDSDTQRTALHEATEGGHTDITELLLKQSEVDPTIRDDDDHTPYDIAYSKNNAELMLMLQMALPRAVRPYSLLLTNTEAASQTITSLVLKDTSTIITGSRDCHVKFFDMVDLAESYSIRLTNTVLGVSIYAGSHLILGSTSIQLVDVESPEKRRTVADDTQEDENLLNPPLHLVQFGPKGQIVTASVESNVVKLWPAVSQNTGHIAYAESTLHVGEDKSSSGCVYSLSISPNPNCPWLAVALQPGKMSRPEGFKLVYCYDLETRKLHHIFDAGDGGLGVEVSVTFSPDGKRLAIGCSEHLCIWETRTGNLLQKFTTVSNASILSLCYSPNGSQLAAGLSSGEVQVFEILSSSPVFVLPPTNDNSPVTAVAYSSCGKSFVDGHKSGTLRLWEAYFDDGTTV